MIPRDEIIRMAREAARIELNVTAAFGDFLEAFGRKVEARAAAAERVACVQACYKAAAGRLYAQDFNACADAIRARGAA